MKRISLYIVTILAAAGIARAADGDLFPYPQAPADMQRLDERCDYIISRFWRQCDFKSAMSRSEKLHSTFGDWIALMPYAHADTVHAAIERLLASVAKNGSHTLTLARMAEDFTYCDTAEFRSSEIFLPFAKAAANHKKISAADREHFASHIRRIENSETGKHVEHLDFTTTEGIKANLDNYHTQMVVLFFNNRDCIDCSMARVRLSADYNINQLIDRKLLTVIFIDTNAADNYWLQSAASYPSNWVIGASTDAEKWFDLSNPPTILLLDGRHKVLAKNLTADGLMAMMAKIAGNS